jgi:hypothetical protein
MFASQMEAYVTLLGRMRQFRRDFAAIRVDRVANHENEPYWVNGSFPALDAISLYGLLALNNPRKYVEIGAGNSTKFARRAIQDHKLRTKVVVIEPFRNPQQLSGLYDELIQLPLEEVDSAFFDQLSPEDLLFFDGSHRAFQNSDVTVFFLEILFSLPPGIIFGIHDIYLPDDYPPEWSHRFYNEQYLLACYLLAHSQPEEILLPNAYVSFKERQIVSTLDEIWRDLDDPRVEQYGGLFWMKKL